MGEVLSPTPTVDSRFSYAICHQLVIDGLLMHEMNRRPSW